MNSKKAERVVIIGVDGAGRFVTQANTPKLDSLFAVSAHTYDAQTVFPSISAQCWGSLLYGVPPERHGIDNHQAANNMIPHDFAYESVFRAARKRWPDAKLASFCCWSPINTGIIEPSADVHTVSMSDPELGEQVIRYIRENPDFKMLFIVFDGVDAAGHQFGFGSAEYLEAISQTDKLAGEVLETLQEQNLWDDTLLISVTDHGGGGEHLYDHGSADPQDMTIFWSAAGPGVSAGAIEGPVTIMDTAAVIAKALDLPVKPYWSDKLVNRIFQA